MGPPAPAARDRPAHHQPVLDASRPSATQPRPQLGAHRRQLDDRLDPRLVAAGADQRRRRRARRAAGPAPRPGCSCRRPVSPVTAVSPGPKRQLELVDQRKAGDAQQRQHGRAPSSDRPARTRLRCATRLALRPGARPRRAFRAGCRRNRAAAGRARSGRSAPPHLDRGAARQLAAPLTVDGQRDRRRRTRCGSPGARRARNTSGRLVSVCGQIGVSTIASQVGRQDRPARRQRVGGRAGRRRRRSGRRPCRSRSRRRRGAPPDRAGARSSAGSARRRSRRCGSRRSRCRPGGRIVTARRMRSSIGRPPARRLLDRGGRLGAGVGGDEPRLPRLTPKIGTP